MLFDNPLSKYLIFEMIYCMQYAIAVLDYLPKFERGLWLAFSSHFLHDFSADIFLI